MDAHTLRPREFADAQSHPSIGVIVFLHIRDVRCLDAYRLDLGFSDGRRGIADPETLLWIIQSVPSPKAEPIKLCLAGEG